MEGRGDGVARPCVAKSYSFGGYGGSVSVLSRGDSVTSTHSAGPRLLTKQDSSTSTISWRLSPSSSGYKSQSQRSDSVTPSPTATPHPPPDQCTATQTTSVEQQVVWAVSHIGDVPKGVMLIDPATLQPFTNQDGTVYHHDPSNPLPGLGSTKPPPSPVKNVATSPRKSPVKEQQSPTRNKGRSKSSPAKKINSATSPSLPSPITPPQPVPPPCYTNIENQNSMSMQPYVAPAPVYTAPEQFQQIIYPMHAPPPETDMSAYFVNMSINEPPPPVAFAQPPPQYWPYQPYQPGKWHYPPEPVPLYGYPPAPPSTYTAPVLYTGPPAGVYQPYPPAPAPGYTPPTHYQQGYDTSRASVGKNKTYSRASSGGSSSPANAVISGYIPGPAPPPPAAYRQCTPPGTPPTQPVPPFTYPPPPTYPQHIFRPVSI